MTCEVRCRASACEMRVAGASMFTRPLLNTPHKGMHQHLPGCVIKSTTLHLLSCCAQAIARFCSVVGSCGDAAWSLEVTQLTSSSSWFLYLPPIIRCDSQSSVSLGSMAYSPSPEDL